MKTDPPPSLARRRRGYPRFHGDDSQAIKSRWAKRVGNPLDGPGRLPFPGLHAAACTVAAGALSARARRCSRSRWLSPVMVGTWLWRGSRSRIAVAAVASGTLSCRMHSRRHSRRRSRVRESRLALVRRASGVAGTGRSKVPLAVCSGLGGGGSLGRAAARLLASARGRRRAVRWTSTGPARQAERAMRQRSSPG